MTLPCGCKVRFIIQRRDGKGERVVCRTVTEVRKLGDKLRLTDPIGVTTCQYEVVEERSYYTPAEDL